MKFNERKAKRIGAHAVCAVACPGVANVAYEVGYRQGYAEAREDFENNQRNNNNN